MCLVHVVNRAFVTSVLFFNQYRKINICIYTVLSSVVEKALSNDMHTSVAVACMSVFRTCVFWEAITGSQSVQLSLVLLLLNIVK
jgi:hypothetical protein